MGETSDGPLGGAEAYGEGGAEAGSMDRAAEASVRGSSGPSPADCLAQAKVVPADAGPVGHGSTETDVKANLAEVAEREAAKAATKA